MQHNCIYSVPPRNEKGFGGASYSCWELPQVRVRKSPFCKFCSSSFFFIILLEYFLVNRQPFDSAPLMQSKTETCSSTWLAGKAPTYPTEPIANCTLILCFSTQCLDFWPPDIGWVYIFKTNLLICRQYQSTGKDTFLWGEYWHSLYGLRLDALQNSTILYGGRRHDMFVKGIVIDAWKDWSKERQRRNEADRFALEASLLIWKEMSASFLLRVSLFQSFSRLSLSLYHIKKT